MVTKSKSIKYSPAVRIISAVLAAVFFGLSGYFASGFVKSFANYNTYENRSFENTDIFRRIMNSYEDCIICNAEMASCHTVEEFAQTETGKSIKRRYDDMKKEISLAYDVLDSSGIQIFITEDNKFRYRLKNGNGAYYYFAYDGTLISVNEFDSYKYISDTVSVTTVQQTTPAAKQYSDIQQLTDALDCIWSLGDGVNYGEISKDALLQRFDSKYKTELENAFDLDVISRSGLFAKIKNIKYALYLTNGTVCSNCGITGNISFDDAVKRLGNGAIYYEKRNGNNYSEYVGKKYEKSKSALAEINREVVTQSSTLRDYHNMEENFFVRSAVFAVPENMQETDILSSYRLFFNTFAASPAGKTPIAADTYLTVIFFVAACALCIFMLSTAGKTENGDIKLLFIDRVPFILNLIIYPALAIFSGAAAFCIIYFEVDFNEAIYIPNGISELLAARSCLLAGILTSICFCSLTVLSNSIARNVRAKTFYKHTLTRILLIPFKAVGRKIGWIFDTKYIHLGSRKNKIIALSAVSVFAVIDFFAVSFAWDNAIIFFTVLLVNVAALAFVLLIINAYSHIDEGTAEIRNGNMQYKIPQKLMPPFMKGHAEDICSIGDGLNTAVNNAVKDRQMKVELITNVTHDLKTPLTSIVNYVDLLKKCEVKNEEAEKYIDILDEKSQKMKKLIEDLVEASKASSGAVEIHPVNLNLCEFALQVTGENEAELKEKGIDIILRLPESPVNVLADPQKTYRISENLFSNIKKYALENTRVYIEVTDSEGMGIISFKNISKYELNIPAEELTARFVRGDISRNSEGNGLGLSIADNLCRLQNGKFTVTADGDLFKAEIRLPKV